MRFILSSLILLSILSCGKESPAVTDPVISYTLTVSSVTGGSVSSPGGSYNQGQSVSITATPNPEYVFVNWSNGSTDNPLSITVNSNQTVTANFEKRKYPLTVSITGSGTVSEEIISSGKTITEYNSGTVVRLTATPSQGWSFIGWSGSVSSTENPIELTVNESKTVSVSFNMLQTNIPFVSKSERYSIINETTGYFNNQNNFYRYTTDSLARSLEYRKEDCSNYVFSTSDQVTYDFNNDGYLDSVGFLYNSNPCVTGFSNGKIPGLFAVYNDFFNGGSVQYFETDLRWVAGDWELNDIDGDGDFEIVLWNYNRHESEGFPLKDVTILDVDQNLNIIEIQLNFTGFDFHNGSSGDIDNDGDIDIMKWSLKGTCCGGDRSQSFPKLLINDGSGSFTETSLLEDEVELDEIYYGGWRNTTNELFDLNNDGYLDIIAGYNFANYELNGLDGEIYILWGSDSGRFNTDNMIIIEDSNYLNVSQIYLGSSFTDYDNDGDMDLIITSTPNSYSGFIINIFQNNGDSTFTDVTVRDCDLCYDNGDNFTHFYRFYSIDRDNDGDFDLVPGDVNSWNGNDHLDNLYWENVGGRFEIRKEN